MKISWKPCASTSSLHAAHAIACQLPLTDARVEVAIREPAQGLTEFVSRLPSSARRKFWGELLSWSVEYEVNRDLAERVLSRILDRESVKTNQIAALSGLITEIEAAYVLLFPKLVEQLELRSRPLREIWEGYGNGLLAHIGRLTERELLVDQAEVILVQPVLGGYGMAQKGPNRVYVEALLANAIPELPEVVRLAWLLAQLQSEMPSVRERIGEHRRHEIANLAMLPPVLAAGQVVELTKIDEANIALAIEQWQIPVPVHLDSAPKLLSWWETYLQTKPAWSIALTALDRMFGAT